MRNAKNISYFLSKKFSMLIFIMMQLFVAYIHSKDINGGQRKFFFQDELVDEIAIEKSAWEAADKNDHCLENSEIEKESHLNLNMERRFILGKCSPVLFIAGFLGVRLVASVDCKSLVTDLEKFYELRYFCGKSVCKEAFFGGYDVEEYTLWPALFNNPFKLLQDDGNKDNSCFAYFMRHLNSENDCPIDPKTKRSLCLYNKNIKITFFGDTQRTVSKSECGTRAISRIVDGGYSVIPESLINSPAAQGFYEMVNAFREKGYSTGFSMAGLPYDFRKFHMTNEQFKEKFETMVNMLHRNTGKKVIIAAHSLGNLNALRILNKDNPINSKIKRYIGLVPPFLGAAKVVEFFSTGSEEFRMKLFLSEYIDISSQAQKFYATYMPVSYTLTLKPKLHQLTQLEEYKDFIDALKERFDLEKNCGILSQAYDKECTLEFIKKHSKKFNTYFPSFPRFDSKVCIQLRSKIVSDLQSSDFLSYKSKNREDIFENLPSYEGCEIRIFDFLRCPFIKLLNGTKLNENFKLEDFHEKCFDDYDKIVDNNYIFNHDCKSKPNSQNCLLNFFKNYTNYEVKNFFKVKDPEYKVFPEKLDVTQEEYQRDLELMTSKMEELESPNDFDSPKVPTSIVYSSYLDTKNNYIYNASQTNLTFTKENINYFGGDGTVSTYSSLIPAMKWLYDNKKASKQIQHLLYNSVFHILH